MRALKSKVRAQRYRQAAEDGPKVIEEKEETNFLLPDDNDASAGSVSDYTACHTQALEFSSL